MAHIQDALKVAYYTYSAFDATKQMGQKTSNFAQVIKFEVLNSSFNIISDLRLDALIDSERRKAMSTDPICNSFSRLFAEQLLISKLMVGGTLKTLSYDEIIFNH